MNKNIKSVISILVLLTLTLTNQSCFQDYINNENKFQNILMKSKNKIWQFVETNRIA